MFLRAVISAVGLTVLLNTCFHVLFYFICTASTCLCSQINDDDDDDAVSSRICQMGGVSSSHC